MKPDTVTIANPCSVPWSQMDGDDRARHCGACGRNVYNLSVMDEPDTQAVLARRGSERVCVMLAPPASTQARLRASVARIPALAGAAMLMMAAAGCSRPSAAPEAPPPAPPEAPYVLGELPGPPAGAPEPDQAGEAKK